MSIEKKQKYIPVPILERVEQLHKQVKDNYLEWGFVKPPSFNEVLWKALITGILEMEKSLNTPITEYLPKKEEKLKKAEKTQKKEKKKMDSNLKGILGDFE